jgi:hypothetical protein
MVSEEANKNNCKGVSMQFFIINEDPKISARLLPDYCLKAVNAREGFQMLSDIGHLFDVKWEGQNNHYNAYHAETRKFWRNLRAFDCFIAHYEACLIEYELRQWNRTEFHERYMKFRPAALPELRSKISAHSNKYSQVIKYLLDRKSDKLTTSEIARLESMA